VIGGRVRAPASAGCIGVARSVSGDSDRRASAAPSFVLPAAYPDQRLSGGVPVDSPGRMLVHLMWKHAQLRLAQTALRRPSSGGGGWHHDALRRATPDPRNAGPLPSRITYVIARIGIAAAPR